MKSGDRVIEKGAKTLRDGAPSSEGGVALHELKGNAPKTKKKPPTSRNRGGASCLRAGKSTL